MRGTWTLVFLVATAGLAGCTQSDDGGGQDGARLALDTIVPGTWNVAATTDYSYIWVRNDDDAAHNAAWSLTLAGGSPLPKGWAVRFDPPRMELAPAGTPMDPATRSYPAWGGALAILEVPEGTTGQYEAELRFGSAVQPVTITVSQPFVAVSQPGSTVKVAYKGAFEATGETFDEGGFSTILGSGQTVPGFDNGLVGLAVGEEVTLVIPPPFAYGYDNPPGRFERFNGQTLLFTVSLESIEGGSAPRPALDPRCADQSDVPDPRGPFEGQDQVRVRFRTTLGDFVVVTDTEHTPRTVENFLRYVDDGFYTCTVFHRISPGFVVQGGGFLADHQTQKPTRDPIPLEATTEKPNIQWSLSMARTNAPNSATSQFFINLDDNGQLDPTGPGTGYAVFAYLVEGQETIEALVQVEPGRSFGTAGGHYPKEPIVILHAART